MAEAVTHIGREMEHLFAPELRRMIVERIPSEDLTEDFGALAPDTCRRLGAEDRGLSLKSKRDCEAVKIQRAVAGTLPFRVSQPSLKREVS